MVNRRTKKWKVIRVDDQVYQKIVDRKELLEDQLGTRVTMNEALWSLMTVRSFTVTSLDTGRRETHFKGPVL